jgi:hypothetical protein
MLFDTDGSRVGRRGLMVALLLGPTALWLACGDDPNAPAQPEQHPDASPVSEAATTPSPTPTTPPHEPPPADPEGVICSAEHFCYENPLPGAARYHAWATEDGLEGWAVGIDGWALHYAGGVWRPRLIEHGAWLMEIAATGPSDVWASGYNDTLFHYDGRTWARVAGPAAASDAQAASGNLISGIWPRGPNDMLVCRGGIEYHFDGNHWDHATGLPPGETGCIDPTVTSPGEAMVIGSSRMIAPSQYQRPKIYRYAAGVYTELQLDTPATVPDAGGFPDISAVFVMAANGPRDLYLQYYRVSNGMHGIVHWDGSHFEDVPIPDASAVGYGAYTDKPGELWADLSPSGNGGRLCHRAGGVWTCPGKIDNTPYAFVRVRPTTASPFELHGFFDNGVIHRLSADASGIVSKPVDSTSNFVPRESDDLEDYLIQVGLASKDEAWALAHQHVFQRGGGDASSGWHPIAMPDESSTDYFRSLLVSGPGDAWIAGKNVYRFRNGTAQKVFSGPPNAYYQVISASSADDVWMAGRGLEHFNGSTFSIATPAGQESTIFTRATARAVDDAWFAGNGLWHWDGMTVSPAKSADGGAPPPEFANLVLAIHAPAKDDLWLWLEGPGLVRWDGQVLRQVTRPAKWSPTARVRQFIPSGGATFYVALDNAAFDHWNGTAFDGYTSFVDLVFGGTAADAKDGAFIAVARSGGIVSKR